MSHAFHNRGDAEVELRKIVIVDRVRCRFCRICHVCSPANRNKRIEVVHYSSKKLHQTPAARFGLRFALLQFGQTNLKESIMRHLVSTALSLSMFISIPMVVGCDRDVKREESTVQHSDGTVTRQKA